jgi:hypothetical protein
VPGGQNGNPSQHPVDPRYVVGRPNLRENLAAGQLTLSPQTLAELDGIAAATEAVNH